MCTGEEHKKTAGALPISQSHLQANSFLIIWEVLRLGLIVLLSGRLEDQMKLPIVSTPPPLPTPRYNRGWLFSHRCFAPRQSPV